MNKIPILVIAGPTASGKTSLSIECAKRLCGEIVSADSMQIYVGMDIATAKPTNEEKEGIPHHLMSFVDPFNSSYSVADYVVDAKKAIEEISSRGHLPIIVGGTGLYIDSLINNVKFTETETDLNLRKSLEEKMQKIGAEEMLKELLKFDEATAKRLHPNNTKRIIRAFEVYELTGKTQSEINAESKNEPSPFDVKYIALNYRNREILYDRVNKRVDLMVGAGLVEEAREYLGKASGTSVQAIGYKELKPYFDGSLTLDEALNNLKQATRNYAKRQITWFNKSDKVNWIYIDEEDSIIDKALKIINS